jgi:hypothetical protein
VAVTVPQPAREYVTVYVVVAFGATLIVAPERFPGDHEKVPPGMFVVAVSVTVCPEQMVTPDTVIVGEGFTVIVTGVNWLGQPPPPPTGVIITWPFPPGLPPPPTMLDTFETEGSA